MSDTDGDDWLTAFSVANTAGLLEERDRAHRARVRDIVVRLLDVVDAIDRVVAQDAGGSSPHGALVKLAERALSTAGGVLFGERGDPYDPTRHEVVELVDRTGHAPEEETIEAVIARGCEWEGGLLRPARIVLVRWRDGAEEEARR